MSSQSAEDNRKIDSVWGSHTAPKEEREDNAATSRFYFKKRSTADRPPGLRPAGSTLWVQNSQDCYTDEPCLREQANKNVEQASIWTAEDERGWGAGATAQWLIPCSFSKVLTSAQHPIKLVAATYNSSSRGSDALSWPEATLITTTNAHKYRHIIKITTNFLKNLFSKMKNKTFSAMQRSFKITSCTSLSES